MSFLPNIFEDTYVSTSHVPKRLHLWFDCEGCGKRYQDKVLFDDATSRNLELSLRIFLVHSVHKCRMCKIEDCRAMDWCPELIQSKGCVSRCRLSFAHAGQCEPHGPSLEELRELRQRKAAS